MKWIALILGIIVGGIVGFFLGYRAILVEETNVYSIGFDQATKSKAITDASFCYLLLKRNSVTGDDRKILWITIDTDLLVYKNTKSDLADKLKNRQGVPMLHEHLSKISDPSELPTIKTILEYRKSEVIKGNIQQPDSDILKLSNELGL